MDGQPVASDGGGHVAEQLHALPTPCHTAQVDSLNRERKLQQHAAGSELGKLEAEYLGLVHKVGAGLWVLAGSCGRC